MEDYFAQNWESYDQWYERHRKEYADQLEFLRSVIPEGKGIEIGVGTGRFASELGIEYGVDIVEEMVEASKGRGIKAVVADAVNLPFNENSFDYSFSIVTMCFLKEPERVLLESRRVARTVITVILDRNSEYVQQIMRNPDGFYAFATFYSEDDIVRMYRKLGFKSISVSRRDLVTTSGKKYTLVAVTGQ